MWPTPSRHDVSVTLWHQTPVSLTLPCSSSVVEDDDVCVFAVYECGLGSVDAAKGGSGVHMHLRVSEACRRVKVLPSYITPV